MATEWQEVLGRLLALQELDLRIQRLDEQLDRGPSDFKTRQDAIAAIDAKCQPMQERMRLLRAQILLRENDLRASEAKIQKLKQQASEVRTNKEFVAFRSEISNAQGECDRLQNEVLKILDVVEQAEQRVKELETERQHELDMSARAQAAMDGRMGDVRAQRDGLRKQRAQRREGIPAEALGAYDRVHEARGRAMAALEGGYCSGCGDVQTRNDVYVVQNRARLVLCPGCNRILYQP